MMRIKNGLKWSQNRGKTLHLFTNINIIESNIIPVSSHYPIHQLPHLHPTMLHTLTPDQDHQKFILPAVHHFSTGCSQARPSIRRYSSFDPRPPLHQHLVRIFPFEDALSNIILPGFLVYQIIIIRTIVDLGCHNIPKCTNLHRMHAQLSHILGSRQIVDVRKTMRIRPIGPSQAQLPGQLIHLRKIQSHGIDSLIDQVAQLLAIIDDIFVELTLLDQIYYCAPDLGHLVGCIVAAWEHHAVEKILERDLDVWFQLGCCANQRAGLFCHVQSDFCCNQAMGLQKLKDCIEVHYLCQ